MARSSPSVPETRMKGTSGGCFCANSSAAIPSKVGSAKSERMMSKPSCSMAAMKSSRVSTRFASQTMPSVLRVDKTRSASIWLSSRYRTWRGDFIGFIDPISKQTLCHSEMSGPPFHAVGRRLVDGRPKDPQFLDCFCKIVKIDRFYHVSINSQFVTFSQIGRLTRRRQHDDGNHF